MSNNQEITQSSETSFHIKSAKFLCQPCNRQFSCVNPENDRAACPRCEQYSTITIEDAQNNTPQTITIEEPSETSFHIRSTKFYCQPCNRQFSCVNPENGRAACPRCEQYSTQIVGDVQPSTSQAMSIEQPQQTQQQPQQTQQQQPRNVQFIRQTTIYRPGQTVIIETFVPSQPQQPSQNTGFGFGVENLFSGFNNLFGGFSQPANQSTNPSDLFGNQQPQQQSQQGFFGMPFGLFFPNMMFFNNGYDQRLLEEFLRQDPNNHGPAPASEQSIKQLNEFDYAPGVCKNGECSVCQDDYNTGDKCVSLPCEHNYHKDCVVEWLKRHDSCPVCRKSISVKQQDNSNRMEEETQQQQAQTGF